jgi:hypothetical protein
VASAGRPVEPDYLNEPVRNQPVVLEVGEVGEEHLGAGVDHPLGGDTPSARHRG